jgi:hypothetical protein
VTTIEKPAATATPTGGDGTGGGGGGGLNAGSILGGGFAPSPSPPPLAPPAPPGTIVVNPKDVDNTLVSYEVDSTESFLTALAAANARKCTVPCSLITLRADIAIGAPEQTLRINNTMSIVGECPEGPCKVDGGGAQQLLKVDGYYAWADIRGLEFANGKHDSAGSGVFGGAGGWAGRPSMQAWAAAPGRAGL